MRKILYKFNLKFESDIVLPVVIATDDMNKIPSLIERNKIIYEATNQSKIIGFEYLDTKYTVQMSDEDYERELMLCDIMDEE